MDVCCEFTMVIWLFIYFGSTLVDNDSFIKEVLCPISLTKNKQIIFLNKCKQIHNFTLSHIFGLLP